MQYMSHLQSRVYYTPCSTVLQVALSACMHDTLLTSKWNHLGYILGKSHNVYMRVHGCDSKHQISVDKLHWVKHVMFVYDRLN